jgi:hypothetical protein
MVHVNRADVRPPRILTGHRAHRLYRAAQKFFSTPESRRRQERFSFAPIFLNDTVTDALDRLFHKKCAYCESIVNVTGHFEVDQFRPKMAAVGSVGDYWPDHYWWLAYEWFNL